LKKLSTLRQLEWMFLSGLASSLASTAIAYTAHYAGFRLPQDVLIAAPGLGLSLSFIHWTRYQFDLLRPRAAATNGYAARMKAAGDEFLNTVKVFAPIDDPDTKTTYTKYRPLAAPEFAFVHSGFTAPVHLSRFIQFVDAGMKRQIKATISNHGKKITRTQAWGVRYFTKERQGVNRFLLPEVKDCQLILGFVGFWELPPSQGHAGRVWQRLLSKTGPALGAEAQEIFTYHYGQPQVKDGSKLARIWKSLI